MLPLKIFRPTLLCTSRSTLAKLVAAGRMRSEEIGNVEILEKFWNFDDERQMPDVVPPVLAYADLLANT